METYGILHDVVHSVLMLVTWWSAASIVGGGVFMLLRMGSGEVALATEAVRG